MAKYRVLRCHCAKGWKIISAPQACQDPNAKKMPDGLFSAQSRVAAIAHSQGEIKEALRHPLKDTAALDALFLTAGVFN